MLLDVLLLFAEADKVPPPGPQDGGWGGLSFPLLMIIIMVLFWVMVILPNQRKERREREALMNSLKKGDEVLTNAGIIGIVANVKDNEVSLKIDDNTRMRILKSTIARILTAKDIGMQTGSGSGDKVNG